MPIMEEKTLDDTEKADCPLPHIQVCFSEVADFLKMHHVYSSV